MLVHNRFVMQALDQLHIHTIDDKTKTRLALLQEIPSGSVVIFTAHGVAPAVKQKAAELGLIGIDASCPDVVKTQAIVQTKLEEGYDVFYIGKAFHPEAEAVISLSPKVHLITNMEDIQQLPTTMSKVLSQIKQQCQYLILKHYLPRLLKHIRKQSFVKKSAMPQESVSRP